MLRYFDFWSKLATTQTFNRKLRKFSIKSCSRVFPPRRKCLTYNQYQVCPGGSVSHTISTRSAPAEVSHIQSVPGLARRKCLTYNQYQVWPGGSVSHTISTRSGPAEVSHIQSVPGLPRRKCLTYNQYQFSPGGSLSYTISTRSDPTEVSHI